MTYARLIARNGLRDGDYGKAPLNWYPSANLDPDVEPDPQGHIMKSRLDALLTARNKAQILAGDLRRLEKDTVDENYICKEIARRTGIDADTVAAVLKEYMTV